MEQRQIVTADRFSVMLGDASYTSYVCHTILLSLFCTPGIRDWIVPTGWVERGFFAYLALIALFSLAFYRLAEHPLHLAYLRRRRN